MVITRRRCAVDTGQCCHKVDNGTGKSKTLMLTGLPYIVLLWYLWLNCWTSWPFLSHQKSTLMEKWWHESDAVLPLGLCGIVWAMGWCLGIHEAVSLYLIKSSSSSCVISVVAQSKVMTFMFVMKRTHDWRMSVSCRLDYIKNHADFFPPLMQWSVLTFNADVEV